MADHTEVPEEMHGRWAKILRDEKKNGQLTDSMNVNTRRTFKWWEEEYEEVCEKENQDEVGESSNCDTDEEEEKESTYTHGQIEHSQRCAKLEACQKKQLRCWDL
jgi:hypothetical protein